MEGLLGHLASERPPSRQHPSPGRRPPSLPPQSPKTSTSTLDFSGSGPQLSLGKLSRGPWSGAVGAGSVGLWLSAGACCGFCFSLWVLFLVSGQASPGVQFSGPALGTDARRAAGGGAWGSGRAQPERSVCSSEPIADPTPRPLPVRSGARGCLPSARGICSIFLTSLPASGALSSCSVC